VLYLPIIWRPLSRILDKMVNTRALISFMFIAGSVGLLLGISGCSSNGNSHKVEQFLVGTYTKDASEGVYLLELDTQKNTLQNLGAVAKGTNPSYLAMSKDQNQLFAATGEQNASITRFDFNADSKQFDLTQVMEASGNGACHIAINPDATLAAISNYGTAEVHLFELDKKSTSMRLKSTFKNSGSSANQARQEAAHMHYAQWDSNGKYLYSVDLGTDEILAFDTTQQDLQPIHRIKLTPGDGPRHLAFHPNLPYVYSNNELSNTITVFNQNTQDGSLSEIQRVNLLDGSEEGDQYASAIKISNDGEFLYTAVRGANKLNAYTINAFGGLNLIDSDSVSGNWPRDFAISTSGNFILVANQLSNTVTVLKRDPNTGMLKSTDMSVDISTPSFVTSY